jgi:hypothetical protein
VRFRESFRMKFLFSLNLSQIFFAKTNIFAKVLVFCEILPRKFYFSTSILVWFYGYYLICFETLSGFDHPVGYLNNKTSVSFVLKPDPDLLKWKWNEKIYFQPLSNIHIRHIINNKDSQCLRVSLDYPIILHSFLIWFWTLPGSIGPLHSFNFQTSFASWN